MISLFTLQVGDGDGRFREQIPEEFAVDPLWKSPLEKVGDPINEARVRASFQLVHLTLCLPKTRDGALKTTNWTETKNGFRRYSHCID